MLFFDQMSVLLRSQLTGVLSNSVIGLLWMIHAEFLTGKAPLRPRRIEAGEDSIRAAGAMGDDARKRVGLAGSCVNHLLILLVVGILKMHMGPGLPRTVVMKPGGAREALL